MTQKSKREQIESLVIDGSEKAREIAELVGCSRSYARDILRDIKNPGSLRRQQRKTYDARQEATRSGAMNHREIWTQEDIAYLEAHGQELTIEELALKLRRTYSSIGTAANRYRVNLRKNMRNEGDSQPTDKNREHAS